VAINLSNVFEKKKTLITGGLGFIGSNLAHRLVDLGAEVTLVDSMIDDYGGNLFNISEIEDKVRVNFADIRTHTTMEYLVRGRDYIFNLAGQVSHDDSMKDPYTDLEINCSAQLSLLEACKKHNSTTKIVFASTRQIYGKPLFLPITEEHIVHPTDVNGINKAAGEMYHILYNNVYGVKACSLRLTNTYGPRQLMKHNRQGFIPWFIRLALEGKEIQVWGGEQKRDMNYIDDVVDAFLLAAASDSINGQIYNLGHHKPVSLKDFTESLIKIAGTGSYTIKEFPEERKKIDVGDTYCSFDKISRDLSWQPKIDLQEGLQRTIDFYREHLPHYL
jgi:UDP-glucose 4-epimerase